MQQPLERAAAPEVECARRGAHTWQADPGVRGRGRGNDFLLGRRRRATPVVIRPRVVRASLTSAPEWLRRVVLEALRREDGGDPPSPLAPSAGTLERMHGEEVEDTSGGRAFPEHVRVRCPSGTNERLAKAAKDRGTSRSEWVRRALARALDVHFSDSDSVDR